MLIHYKEDIKYSSLNSHVYLDTCTVKINFGLSFKWHLSNQVYEWKLHVFVFQNCLFLFVTFLCKRDLRRKTGEIIRIKQFSSQQNNVIFHIDD